MRKAHVLQAPTERGIWNHEHITAIEAETLLRKWGDENIEPAVVQIAREA